LKKVIEKEIPINSKRILFIGNEKETQAWLKALSEKMGGSFTAVGDGSQALAMIYNDPPDLIVIDVDRDEEKEEELGSLCCEIKKDNIYGHLPIIAMILKEFLGKERIDHWMIDDFVCKPVDFSELLVRIQLIFSRGEKNLDANALTRLPGNNTIIQQIQERIDTKTPFALAYMDIDNFKAFNDRYGFSRGDEVLRMAARLAGNVVFAKKDPNAFVGHIGGDDFVFIVSPDNVASVCEEIIRNFDQIVPIFYDDEDRRQGFIASVNRQGKRMEFPIMSVSIGVAISTHISPLIHYGQITSIATEMKKYAKRFAGSCYRIDRRKHPGQMPMVVRRADS